MKVKSSKDISLLGDLFRRTGIKPIYFIFSALLAIGASFFEAASVGLLIPLANAVIHLDVSLLKNTPVAGELFSHFPGIFYRNTVIFVTFIGFIFTAVLLKQVLQYASTLTTVYLTSQFTDRLRRLLFNRYLDLGKLFFDRNSAGQLHQILMGMTQALAARLHETQSLVSNFFLLATYLAILFFISWRLTLITVLVFPALHYAVGWLIAKIQRTSTDYAASQGELGKKIFDVLSSILLVKAYTREDAERLHFGRMSGLMRMFEFSIHKKALLIGPLQETISVLAILLLLSVMALMVVRGGGLEAVAKFLVYFYVLRRAAACFGTLNAFKGFLAAASGPMNEIRRALEENSQYRVPDGTKEFPELKKEIRFQQLNFAYDEKVPILKNVHFVIEKGKTTALVGPTGAGKTTLVHLLMRFYDAPPQSILADGEDIRSFTLKSLRGQMAFVSQATLLFHDTLKANLVYGLDGPVSEEKIKEAVRKARLEDYVKSLPAGLGTLIGDRGVQLSGGEKQRVSIARAILKEAQILILDEATSSLDSHTEELIRQALEELTRGRTVIVIAHRLSTIRNADKIVVLESGRVVEEGSPVELLRADSRFHRFWQEQFAALPFKPV